MFPDKIRARELLKKAENNNPGPWVKHSLLVAQCAEKIANKCNMNGEKAYVLGLLHDIGRHFGVKHFGHIVDGYTYMSELGYDEVARVCLSHSFPTHSIEEYIGDFDVSKQEVAKINDALKAIKFDDYDKLIQLCDCLAGTEIVDMKERMADVKKRYGSYPQEKWESNIELKQYFEEKCNENIYVVIDANKYLWGL